MIPDLEKIVSNFLRTHTAVAALTTRIVGKTPTEDDGGTHTAWVRVTQLAAPDVTHGAPDHLIAYLVQFDCYAGSTGGQPQANIIGRTIRAALGDLPGSHDEAVVSRVHITGHARIPDTEFRPARERVIVTAEIRAHAR